MSADKKRILTGDRPTGKLHLGHYAGSLANRVQLQHAYDTFIMVADVQALTDNFIHPEKVRNNVREVVMDNLAVGIDPKHVTLFIQSLIPEIAELTVFFSNLVTLSRLQRNPTVKNEIKEKGHLFRGGNVTYGFLGYPVSQAADILFCRAHLVPVGEDQRPMIEQTREIAEKFNSIYGEVFPLPEAKIPPLGRLAGLDGKKMSKSLNNAIYLADAPHVVREKIKHAKTDSGAEVTYDPEKKSALSNLMTYYTLATGQSYQAIEEEFKGITSYAVFKEKLADVLTAFLSPMQTRRSRYEKDPSLVDDILRAGTARAKQIAEETMALVRERMKIDYFS
ncbi:tryptophan--tRNA ligase [Candidatus Uhrbacteria bacterium RIFCSPHIGHO2_12_FULL_54_23]|uniref:Tryptophan--tRNA ligase n=3 Tax=Candidatus Uhriibacteriota TaxID=1752732 RepID=A0A1F7ULK2_9BACT|nr:MAG: tryptophan--tRNA ligase [Candidatus Uhrbacteria bacterium RIFCSPHIGHO2_12_FULL_54_23]OGL84031.1 MAG: tryptophan--tRNA ligase [Candidatus Uhrbacteria bacterium RIFCSPLOWO2_01_FULL_55_36]OGL90890.1 MAG: tryptophan--tRNA ligase [Candidatus Uhrbacteria bacterium RIFCSPLOWO2_02_FULL_54_37]